MLTTRYTVTLVTPINLDVLNEVTWYSALKNIYNRPGPNFDGYISGVKASDVLDSIDIDCYTLEGPEEKDRLLSVKDSSDDWASYRKRAVVEAIVGYAQNLGYTVTEYMIREAD
jgi:hypothetical protein